MDKRQFAHNPETGEVVVNDGGEWRPVEIIHNEQTREVMFRDRPDAEWQKAGTYSFSPADSPRPERRPVQTAPAASPRPMPNPFQMPPQVQSAPPPAPLMPAPGSPPVVPGSVAAPGPAGGAPVMPLPPGVTNVPPPTFLESLMPERGTAEPRQRRGGRPAIGGRPEAMPQEPRQRRTGTGPRPMQGPPMPPQPVGDYVARFGQGAAEVFAGIPEAISIGAAALEGNVADNQRARIQGAVETLGQIQEALKAPDLTPEMGARLAELAQGQIEILGMLREGEAQLRENVPATERGGFEQGAKVREFAEGIFGKPDPMFDQEFGSKLAGGAGSMAGFIAATIAGAPAGAGGMLIMGAGAGAGVNASSIYREAIAAGADEETAQDAARVAGLVGTLEVLPIVSAIRFLPAKLRAEASKALTRRVLALGQNATEEAIQEAANTALNNLIAQGYYDPERGWSDGVGEAALIGAILGGGVSVGAQAVEAATRPRQRPETPEAQGGTPVPPVEPEPVQPVQPDAAPVVDGQPVEPAAPDAAPPGVPAGPIDEQDGDWITLDVDDGEGTDVAGKIQVNTRTGETRPVPQQAPQDGGPAEAVGVEEDAPNGGPAPTSPPAATPTPTPTEAPATGAAPIRSAPVENAQDTAVTPTGREFPVEYRIVEADDLVPSNLDDGRVNPAFPQSLQPRDRTRPASQQQVQDIANDINPRLLDRNPSAADGAPIISPDGVVESGNGRTMAIRRAYQAGGPSAQRYRQHLEAQGYPTQGFRNPVLVRVNTAGMTDQERAATAVEANERSTMGMSSTERAMADAQALPDTILPLYRGGDVDAVQNREFARKFIESVVADGDRGGMIDANGEMSQEAARRIQAALLAKAYGDAELVAALTEASDTNIKAIGGALLDVAPMWAQMRGAARGGSIAPEMDQTRALMEAVKIVNRARTSGRNVAEFVGQGDLLTGGETVSENGKQFLALFFRDTQQWTKPAGRDRIAGALGFYVDEAMKTSPGADMFGGTADPMAVARTAKERQYGDDAQDQGNLFGQGRGGSEPSVPPPGERPGPDAGGEGAGGGAGGEGDAPSAGAPQAGAEATGPSEVATPHPNAGRWSPLPGEHIIRRNGRKSPLYTNEGPVQLDPANVGEAAKRRVIERGKQTGKEHFVLIDAEGRVVAAGAGNKGTVAMPPAVANAYKNAAQALVFHHNHPDHPEMQVARGRSLSPADFAMTVYEGVDSVYAHAHDGTTYAGFMTDLGIKVLSRSKKQGESDYAAISRNIMRMHDKLIRGIQAGMGGFSREDAGFLEAVYLHHFNDMLRDLGLVAYEAGEGATLGREPMPLLVSELRKIRAALEREITEKDRDGPDSRTASRPVRHPGRVEIVQGEAQGDAGGADGGRGPGVDRPREGDRPDERPADPGDAGPSDFDRALGDAFDEPGSDFDRALGDAFDEPAPTPRPRTQRTQRTAPKTSAPRAPRRPSKSDAAKRLGDLYGDDTLEQQGGSIRGAGESRYDRAVPLFKVAIEGVQVEGRTDREVFADMLRAMIPQGLTRETAKRMQPDFERFLAEVRDGTIDLEADDAQPPGGDVESDRGGEPGDGVGEGDVPAPTGSDGGRAGARGGRSGRGGGGQGGRGGSRRGTATVGGAGDTGGQGQRRPGRGRRDADGDGAAGRDRSEPGLRPDDAGADVTRREAADSPDGVSRREQQAAADKIPVRPGRENVDKTLPLLLPEQRDDVVRIEERWSKPDGHGMLITNGTGTGKTYTGMGAIKRAVRSGKEDILIIAPSQGILDGWVQAGADLGIDITKLSNTRDAGTGVVATTYANMAQNIALYERQWDVVVADESHELMQEKTGADTAAIQAFRGLTGNPRGLYHASRAPFRKEYEAIQKMRDGEPKQREWARVEALRKRRMAELEAKPRAKVLFLSATPFAHDMNVDYAEGYLFSYPEDQTREGSQQSGRNWFMVENFGYRIRYHRLTQPEAAVDRGVFHRQFHERMKREGALWGRQLEVDVDYDRRFQIVQDGVGEMIDRALNFIHERSFKGDDFSVKNDARVYGQMVTRELPFHRRQQILEALKARHAIKDIEKHLEMGRKVVVFHDFNVGGGTNPFIHPIREGETGHETMAALFDEVPEAADFVGDRLRPPKEQILDHFGRRAREYNGTVSKKDRAESKDLFNTDGSGVDVIVVQSDAGSAGLSLHDTTNAHQRALINLGMPTRPTRTLQAEGRTRRVGSASDAIYRYYSTGTSWERQAFARRIAEQSGTVENLALGDEARMVREAFVEAYEEAGEYPPGIEGEGKGGRERDARVAGISEFEKAKTHYFGRQKMRGRRDQRQGIDFFPTPEPLGFKMVEWAGLRPMEKVLEPSAGDGAIARYFPQDVDRTIVEPSLDLSSRAELNTPGARVENVQFEDLSIVNKYDAVVMNPPFGSGGKTAMEHVEKAFRHLRPGGRLVALIPNGPAADKQWERMFARINHEGPENKFRAILNYELQLPAVTFERAGTGVRASVIILDKVPKAEFAWSMVSNRRSDMTPYTDIGRFFDAIEVTEAPARPWRPETTGVDEDMAAAPPPDRERVADPGAVSTAPPAMTFEAAEAWHAKYDRTTYVAKSTTKGRVPRHVYEQVKAIAEEHGGKWSSYTKKGAIPGFQFETAEARDAFLEDMAKPQSDGERLEQVAGEIRPLFYSPLLRAVSEAKQKAAPAGDWKAILAKLPGVKKDEIDWLGVNEWLDMQEGQVTRADLEAFVRESQIEIVEEWQAGEEADARDVSVEVDRNNPVEPNWEVEAQQYIDEAREQLEDEVPVDEDGEPEYEVDDDDAWELAEQMARENWEPREFAADLYDSSTGDYGPSGFYDEDTDDYYFPELDPNRLQDDEAIALWNMQRTTATDPRVTGPAGFEEYTEDGGDNYREILLRVPRLHETGKNEPKPGQNDTKRPFVQSAHFEQENIVVHARVKDRKGAAGERVLFVEEIQSDLGSALRENEPEPEEVTARRRELQRERDRLDVEGDDLRDRAVPVIWQWFQDNRVDKTVFTPERAFLSLRKDMRAFGDGTISERASALAKDALREVDGALYDEVFDHARRLEANFREGVALGTERTGDPNLPDSPFRGEHTYALMSKRLLRLAAEEGYDAVAWTPGYMQAERWNKAGQSVVEGVEWKPAPENQREKGATRLIHLNMTGRGKYLLWTDRAGQIVDASDEVSSAIGKPLSALIGNAANDVLASDSGEISGQKITFPDSGYAIAYDQQTKRAIDKLAKKGKSRVTLDRSMPDMLDFDAMDEAINAGIVDMGPVPFIEAVLERMGQIGKVPDLHAKRMRERAQKAQDRLAQGSDLRDLDTWGAVNAVREIAGKPHSKAVLADRIRDAGKPVWRVDITPDLREQALQPQAILQRPRDGTGTTALDPDAAAKYLPELRRALDEMNLKRVTLSARGVSGAQGALEIGPTGSMDIVIAHSLNPRATMYHEVIHALKAMNLFTPAEWRALEVAAARGWVEKHDIPKRYPDLLPSEQIEEAIAEEFAERAASRQAPKGSLLVTAFNKIARIFKAIRAAFAGQTPDDVFGKVLAGQIGARDAESGSLRAYTGLMEQRQPLQRGQPPAKRAGPGSMAQPHIPDRRIWEELFASNAPMRGRITETGGAIYDWIDRRRVTFQDRFLPVLRAQEAVQRHTGRPLPEEQDAYTHEVTYSGKVGRHFFEIDEQYTKPIIDIIAKRPKNKRFRLTGPDGQTLEDQDAVGLWLMARHAGERNKAIAQINPQMPDGGSGLMTAEAAMILNQARAAGLHDDLVKIGALVDKLRAWQIDMREKSGLLSPEEAAIWRTQYRYYVPLKGFAETDHSEAYLDTGGIGRRFNVRGGETRRALGRRSMAFNPLQGVITQAQEVAIRAEKNRVGQALYELVKENPAPKMWKVKTYKMKRVFNRQTGLVEARPENPISLFMNPNEMAVKIGGKEHRILFTDERLARAAGSVGAERFDAFVRFMQYFSRYFSAINTMLNPVFTIVNGFRDMTAAQINIRGFGGDDRNAIAKSMLLNWPKAFAASYRGLSKLDPGGEWGKWWVEFEAAGGRVNFWVLDNPNAAGEDMGRRIGIRRKRPGDLLNPATVFSTRDNIVLRGVEKVNLAVDNAVRLAAYAEARKRGWSKQKAADLSKNITVNFNRRGEIGAVLNGIYPFYNAAVQGTQVLFRALSHKEVRRTMGSLLALMILNDLINAALSEEDDDGELAYDKIADWRQQMNFVADWMPMANPEKALTVPLPYGHNVFLYAGTQAGKVIRGVKPIEDVLPGMMGAAFGAFSPFSGRTFQETISPTIMDPINQMAANEDWLGRPIRPENPYADYGPDAYKYYGGATQASRTVADFLNRATGGSRAESGWIDVSPEYIDHLAGFLTGGMGRFVGQTADVGAKLATGRWDELEARSYPGYSKLVTEHGLWLDRDRYYRFRDEVREARAGVRVADEQGITIPREMRRLADLNDAAREADKLLREIRQARSDLDAGSATAEQKRARRQALDRREEAVVLRFNKQFLRVVGSRAE